jgi:hypothetical protein
MPPAKPYELSFEERPAYLYAYVEGEHDSYEISRAYWQEVADEAVRTHFRRVLIDENIVECGSMAECFRLASEIPEMGFGNARIAFVDRYLEQNDVNEFGELVASNRGAQTKIFNDVQSAETWLSHG